MSWAIAGGWLAVAGLTFLTTGTAAQAWASLAEFKELRQRVLLDEDFAAIGNASSPIIGMVLAAAWDADNEPWFSRWNLPSWVTPGWVMTLSLYAQVLYRSIITAPRRLANIRAGADDAAKLAQFLRLAVIWGIIMVGSALALVAAVIQLALAYQ